MAAETVTQDQKKRTFDAIERRFALAEAELRQQEQQKNKIVRIASHSPNNYTDAEPNDPTYLALSHPVHENLASTNVKFSGKGRGTVDQILHELLQKGDSGQKYMQGSRSKKIDNWILLDNLVQGRGTSGGARMRALKVQSKRSKKHMSMKQHKRCGSLNLPREFHNLFSALDFIPLAILLKRIWGSDVLEAREKATKLEGKGKGEGWMKEAFDLMDPRIASFLGNLEIRMGTYTFGGWADTEDSTEPPQLIWIRLRMPRKEKQMGIVLPGC
ncbi:hypothetical protein RJ640_007230 [Escallonia rubra]|uniref:Uncharacterized protein n=1 Tax=Escallonia rubra TaxID=112253 RepID=A0AA88UAP8_9ASTE|nr:hypothetical protein RJ640_007230 [Escallonia rubra]